MARAGKGSGRGKRRAATEEDYEALVAEVRAEFPALRLIDKRDSLLQRTIDVALRLVTLGGQSRYLDHYVTTIGARIYLPSSWHARKPRSRIATLRHERVHLRQFRRFSLPLMALAYLLLPVPLGFAWCRVRFEQEAYEESIRARWELRGARRVLRPKYKQRIVREFTGPAYGWMWLWRPSIERWFDGVVNRLVEEHGLDEELARGRGREQHEHDKPEQ